MKDNYQSAGEHIRNIADLQTELTVHEAHGKFRIVELAPPYFAGSAFWVVNEKGFLWEPAKDLASARAYLESDEAREYQEQ